MGSNALNQKTCFQLVDSKLVSTTADNPQPSTIAPPQLVEAIGYLKDEDDKRIFAWLEYARSLEYSLHHGPNNEYLPHNQVRAIVALMHCSINDIITWLHLARTSSAFGNAAASISPHVHSRTSDKGVTQGPSTQPSLPQAKPKFCCTLCGYFRPFKNQSDWRKHEREHHTTYVCMLKGPREATSQGIQCAFCGILNPLDAHLLEHDAQACLQGPPDSFSTKRRHELVNHLMKTHHVALKTQGEAIAMKWKHTVEKQAWSCGFCVTTFATFNDRLSHIATKHFERGQTIAEWDTTKVIQGLLQQLGIRKAWEEKVATLPEWEVQDIIWEKNAITGLQHDLEVGPNDDKSALDLAEAAYIACRLNLGMETNHIMAVSGGNPDEKFVATSFLPNRSQASLVSAPAFGSHDHRSSSAAQESNEFSTSNSATQASSSLTYGSSAPTASLNDCNNRDLAVSSFSLSQIQSVSIPWGYDNSANGDPREDQEENQGWPRSQGSIYDKEFDTLLE